MNAAGMLVEVCAGLLDGEDPETAIRREAEEETVFRIGAVSKVFEAYTSPGSVTEILHFFIAAYSDGDRGPRGRLPGSSGVGRKGPDPGR